MENKFGAKSQAYAATPASMSTVVLSLFAYAFNSSFMIWVFDFSLIVKEYELHES